MGSISGLVLMANNILVSINYIFVIPLVALGIAMNAVVANAIGKQQATAI